ncbi:peptide chain release factor N(5)-glutamine methyltransferase [Winogradskyella maritima]|uniref:Release factor glutamine methyltransferase n=1 Tax=Winogradskyella maritima TaxID=1517766 RepID=A0ABV8AFL2_9FLAO|nr:peptide chain release factor N(5)-glutamine methyltransferase [Winogradskyella maritima]
MLFSDIQNIFQKDLQNLFPKEEIDQFFFMLVEHYFNIARIQLHLDSELTSSKDEQEQLFSALDQLKESVPIQYILGETDFYGLTFKLSEATLIPRPETEELVDWIIKDNTSHSNLKVLDIGTGSGCIAIALAKHLESASVSGVDISSEALKCAEVNSNLNNTKVQFSKFDILNAEKDANFTEQFDIIVSNPPYVRELEKVEIQPNVLNHEPHSALFVSDDNPLVFYAKICEFAVENLKPNGQLYFEINQYLGQEMIALLELFEFENIELRTDYSGNDRMLKAIIPIHI